MGIEIERKFLVDKNQWERLSKSEGTRIKQGYLVNDNGKTIRLRIASGRAYITFKGPASGSRRNEYEYEIPVNDGIELFNLFVKTHIEKTRYNINYKNKVWEADVFSGDNQGLIVAEIELEREDEQFELPPWVTIEVTGQEKYYNSSLSTHPFKKWR